MTIGERQKLKALIVVLVFSFLVSAFSWYQQRVSDHKRRIDLYRAAIEKLVVPEGDLPARKPPQETAAAPERQGSPFEMASTVRRLLTANDFTIKAERLSEDGKRVQVTAETGKKSSLAILLKVLIDGNASFTVDSLSFTVSDRGTVQVNLGVENDR